MYTDLSSTNTPLVMGAAIGITPDRRSIEQCVETLENELDGLSRAMAQRFEELSLIHELSDRLCLEEDLETICDDLLRQLSACIPAETIAIDLLGDEEAMMAPAFYYVGQAMTVDVAHPIAEWTADGSSVTMRNHVAMSQGRPIRIVTVRIAHKQRALGRMIAIRLIEGAEFGTIEADLMKSTSMMLGMHVANQRQYAQIQQMCQGTIQSLVSALDAKDAYTCGHSNRVAELSVELSRRLGFDEAWLDTIRMAGILHDIGKIGIDDAVLRKTGKLTFEEFEQIKQHPVLGYEILRGIRVFRDILPAVRHHHESWDGSGYPDGLVGDEIPRQAQIVAVADAFDAMTSDRPYRLGMALEKVTAIFLKGRGTQWAADVVDALLGAPELMERYARHEASETV